MVDSDEFDFQPEIIQPSDIDKIKSIVSQYFKIYDVRWNERTAAFYINYYPDELEHKFEDLRVRLKQEGMIPRISKEEVRYIIYVIRIPKVKKRNVAVNFILIILTFITTTWAGAILWFSRIDVNNSFEPLELMIKPLLNSESVLFGFLSFALPLMIILGTHETAHYLAAKKHKIDASLPYFIPLPPPFILGTMGAFISMREPISNKKALLDIGAAGPIAGFLASIPILIIGFILESMDPVIITEVSSDMMVFNEPLLFYGLRSFFPSPENTLMHPTAFAGWVGLFVTALNLIPGGQLDGGHIARALLGDKAKFLSVFVIFVLFVLSFITNFFLWIFFALIILMLGTSHPPPLNDISPLGHKRKAIGAFCMVMLLLCIHYAPISQVTVPDYDLEIEYENIDRVVAINGTVGYLINITNTGEDGDIEFFCDINTNNSNISDWDTDILIITSKDTKIQTTDGRQIKNVRKFDLKRNDFFQILINVTPNQNVSYGGRISHKLQINISGMNTHSETVVISTHVGTFDMSAVEPKCEFLASKIRQSCDFVITVENLVEVNDTINFTYNLTTEDVTGDSPWEVSLNLTSVNLGASGTPDSIASIYLHVIKPASAVAGDEIDIELTGISESNPQAYDIVNLSVYVKES